MFQFDISDTLKKKLKKLSSKDKVICIIFRKKLREVIDNDVKSINRYKNLRKPLQDLKRIHLTSNFILLFKVYSKEKKILFIDIKHWDTAY